jgi:hypothetical protein
VIGAGVPDKACIIRPYPVRCTHPRERLKRLPSGTTNAKREHVSETAPVATYAEAENQVLSASNGVDCAYRSTGESDQTGC